jgi:hypothetical protein
VTADARGWAGAPKSTIGISPDYNREYGRADAITKTLQPTDLDQFETGDEGIAFRFRKNAKNEVTGFSLAGMEIRNIEFLATPNMSIFSTTF